MSPEDAPDPLHHAIVAIGASGGQGMRDIEAVLAGLTPDLPAVVMVVLHRPVDRVSHLRDMLARTSALPVHVACGGERLHAGCCYIGEPAAHLTLAANAFGKLTNDPFNSQRNRTIDGLFRSVALHAGPSMIGVVLSGSLDDGARGLAAIHAAGGVTLVLTPENPRTPGMPENAIRYDGPIDLIGSAAEIAAEIVRRVSAGKG